MHKIRIFKNWCSNRSECQWSVVWNPGMFQPVDVVARRLPCSSVRWTIIIWEFMDLCSPNVYHVANCAHLWLLVLMFGLCAAAFRSLSRRLREALPSVICVQTSNSSQSSSFMILRDWSRLAGEHSSSRYKQRLWPFTCRMLTPSSRTMEMEERVLMKFSDYSSPRRGRFIHSYKEIMKEMHPN